MWLLKFLGFLRNPVKTIKERRQRKTFSEASKDASGVINTDDVDRATRSEKKNGRTYLRK